MTDNLPVLNSDLYGNPDKPAMLIAHGLFGSARNWSQVAGELSEDFYIHALDLRNHGGSFHHPSHTIEDLADDIENYMQQHNLTDAIMLGHSMGALAMMQFAFTRRQKVVKLIIADIVWRNYQINYDAEFALLETDLSGFNTRKEIEARLEKVVPDMMVRKFLMTNIERDDNGNYYWRLNVEALKKNRSSIELPQHSAVFGKKTLLVYGQSSGFVQPADIKEMNSRFSHLEVQQINGAGHWLHYSHRKEFLEKLATFLRS